MEKSDVMAKFEEMLAKRFPNRPIPISKNVPDPQPKIYNDSRFDKWRKK